MPPHLSTQSQTRFGSLSLVLHGAKINPASVSTHNNTLFPVAFIQLPNSSRRYQSRSGEGLNPIWKDEFELMVIFNQSNQETNLQGVYQTIDEGFEELSVESVPEQSNSKSENDDLVLIEILDDSVHRHLIGRATLSLSKIANQPMSSPSNEAPTMQVPLAQNGGSLELTAVWTEKPLTQAERDSLIQSHKQLHSPYKHGRFLVTDSSDDESSQSSDSRALSNDQSSGSIHDEEISGTASTDTGSSSEPSKKQSSNRSSDPSSTSSEQQTSKSLPAQNLLDRRSSSTESAHSLDEAIKKSIKPTQQIDREYSTPHLEDTYTSHANRHVASFLPTLTRVGDPFWHSTGRHGLLYDDSTCFDDRNYLYSLNQQLNNQSFHAAVCEVRVWSRDFIHGIQITYAVQNSTGTTVNNQSIKHVLGPRHVGRVHTTEHVLKLHHSDGEYIIGIEGTFREWIETLTIITNRRSHTYGGNVDQRPTKWKPAGSPKAPVQFRCDVPPGHRVVGFMGGYGVHLHNIGVFHAPVSAQDMRRKCSVAACVFTTLKKKLSHGKLDSLDH